MIRFVILLFLFSGEIYAKTSDSLNVVVHRDLLGDLQKSNANGGHVILHGDPSINNLLKLHIQLNQKRKSFSGYRIQIYSATSFGSNMEQLKLMRDNFEKEFPDMPAYLNYFDPDFKIRAGNFRTRLECIPALHRIKKRFPASYPVKTDITLEELKRLPFQERPVSESEEPALPATDSF